jgi:hypothetical protein
VEQGAATMEGGGRRAHTQEETWTALNRLPGRKRVRREAALQSGAATKARRLMTRRAPRPVVLAARGRRGGDVARGEGDHGEELGRWEDPQATRGHVQ